MEKKGTKSPNLFSLKMLVEPDKHQTSVGYLHFMIIFSLWNAIMNTQKGFLFDVSQQKLPGKGAVQPSWVTLQNIHEGMDADECSVFRSIIRTPIKQDTKPLLPQPQRRYKNEATWEGTKVNRVLYPQFTGFHLFFRTSHVLVPFFYRTYFLWCASLLVVHH